MPSTAATTTDMYSGRQPAMTALIATFSAVTDTDRFVMKAISLLGIEPRRGEHHAHAVFGRRNDRQAVGPPLLEAELARRRHLRRDAAWT